MTTRFVLVRHATCAQTESVLLGRTIDAPLDARGERQASALAERLRAEDPIVVEASPRRRARQTAEAIAAPLRREVRVASALDELDFGAWAGRPFAELESEPGWRRWNEQRGAARTPAGEDIAGVQARIGEHLRALAAGFAGATLVLVTHGEVIRSAVMHFLGRPADDYHRIEIGPASMTTLVATAGDIRVEAVDERVAP